MTRTILLITGFIALLLESTNVSATVCVVSFWAEWGSCVGNCNFSLQVRNRNVVRPPFPETTTDGRLAIRPCPPLYQVQTCAVDECPPDEKNKKGAPRKSSHPKIKKIIDIPEGALRIKSTSPRPIIRAVHNSAPSIRIQRRRPLNRLIQQNPSKPAPWQNTKVSPRRVQKLRKPTTRIDVRPTTVKQVRTTVSPRTFPPPESSRFTPPPALVLTPVSSENIESFHNANGGISFRLGGGSPHTFGPFSRSDVTQAAETTQTVSPEHTNGNPCSSPEIDSRCCPKEELRRSSCVDGRRLQRVIRWMRSGSDAECTPYNYSYCGGIVEQLEKPIKFEEECYELCFDSVEKRTSKVFSKLRFQNGFRLNTESHSHDHNHEVE